MNENFYSALLIGLVIWVAVAFPLAMFLCGGIDFGGGSRRPEGRQEAEPVKEFRK